MLTQQSRFFNITQLTPNLKRISVIAIGCLLTAVLTPANAASNTSKGRNVDTTLVSNWSDTEGDLFYAAILFEINEGWHTYWKNPGTTGMATEVEWILPQGMHVESVYETAPHLYNNAGLVDYVHEEFAMVVAAIRLEDTNKTQFSGTKITANVNWLECETLCVPGNSELELELTNDNTTFSATISEQVGALISAHEAALSGIFHVQGEQVSFQLEMDRGIEGAIESAYFFPGKSVTDAASEQHYKVQNGTILIQTKISPYDEPAESDLSGWLVIKTRDGDSHYRWYKLVQGKILSVAGLSDGSEATISNFPLLLLLAFVGGMILNLMPCVFPVIGLKIMGFVEQAGQDKRKIMLHGLVFTAGVLISFWLLSSLLLLLRAGGEQLGWGFQLQEPWFNYALILLMLAFALSLNGVFEFGMSAIGMGGELQRKSGISGSFFSGVLATVVATPCSAPFLAPALGAALALAPWQAMLLFTFIALGLSTPYLLLSAFPGILKVLPKPGAWMETFKQFMAFPLYGTVAYLLWALLGQIDDANQLNLLLSLALFAMAFWVYGRWAAPHRKKRVRNTAILSAFAMLVFSVWFGHPKQKKEFWQPWSPEAVARYVEEGKTVYVDFTARWCATCQLNKRVVFGSEEVLQAFEKGEVVALKADWTNRDERITKRLKALGKAAVPVNLVYKNGENEPVILPEVLTPGIVLKAISSN